MESYIVLSELNDFIFCPRSIYFHHCYSQFDQRLYHRAAQTKGRFAHQNIDNKDYTTSAHILQAIEVFSQKYNLHGKIDVYNSKTKELIERKRQIKTIYDGYIFQLYGQYFALTESGFEVKTLKLHSLVDNKRYNVDLPSQDKEMLQKFEQLIANFKSFQLNGVFKPILSKCQNCIYSPMCDASLC